MPNNNTFGLSNSQFDLLKKLVIDPIKGLGGKVLIFGSRARGDHHPFSDIDVLFSLPHEVSPSALGKIKEDAEESQLAIKVDLVEVNQLAQSYVQNVMQERVEI